MAKYPRNVKIMTYVGIALLVVIAAVSLSYLSKAKAAEPGKYDELAQCVSASGAIMYGTEWCPHCQTQKKLFGNSFQYVNYIDCDRSRSQCEAAGITGYPTWVFGDGSRASGTQDLYNLGQKSGCKTA